MFLWKATYTNTLSTTHLIECAVNPGAAARAAKDLKRHRYDDHSGEHEFIPLAFETMSILCLTFEQLGRRIRKKAVERQETDWLR